MKRASKLWVAGGVGCITMTWLIGNTLAVATSGPADAPALKGILLAALDRRGSFISVHAAEALLTLGQEREAVRAAFAPQADVTTPGYRVGVWRVLARAETEPQSRRAWVERIRGVLLDNDAADRLHAVETLAKLAKVGGKTEKDGFLRVNAGEEGYLKEKLGENAPAARPFALWRLHQSGDAGAVWRLVGLLRDSDPVARARAAYVLGKLQPLPVEANDAIWEAVGRVGTESPERVGLIAAARGCDARALLRTAALLSKTPGERYTALMAIAEQGPTGEDVGVLAGLARDADEDVRVAAALVGLRAEQLKQTPAATTRAVGAK